MPIFLNVVNILINRTTSIAIKKVNNHIKKKKFVVIIMYLLFCANYRNTDIIDIGKITNKHI